MISIAIAMFAIAVLVGQAILWAFVPIKLNAVMSGICGFAISMGTIELIQAINQ